MSSSRGYHKISHPYQRYDERDSRSTRHMVRGRRPFDCKKESRYSDRDRRKSPYHDRDRHKSSYADRDRHKSSSSSDRNKQFDRSLEQNRNSRYQSRDRSNRETSQHKSGAALSELATRFQNEKECTSDSASVSTMAGADQGANKDFSSTRPKASDFWVDEPDEAVTHKRRANDSVGQEKSLNASRKIPRNKSSTTENSKTPRDKDRINKSDCTSATRNHSRYRSTFSKPSGRLVPSKGRRDVHARLNQDSRLDRNKRQRKTDRNPDELKDALLVDPDSEVLQVTFSSSGQAARSDDFYSSMEEEDGEEFVGFSEKSTTPSESAIVVSNEFTPNSFTNDLDLEENDLPVGSKNFENIVVTVKVDNKVNVADTDRVIFNQVSKVMEKKNWPIAESAGNPVIEKKSQIQLRYLTPKPTGTIIPLKLPEIVPPKSLAEADLPNTAGPVATGLSRVSSGDESERFFKPNDLQHPKIFLTENTRMIKRELQNVRKMNRSARCDWGERSLEAFEIISQVKGQIYKARDKHTGDFVALKKISIAVDEKEGFPKTSIQEIISLGQIEHPNIIQLFDVMVDQNNKTVLETYGLIFEYVNHDICGLLQSNSFSFDEHHIASVMKQLLLALAYCHQNNVVHGDIKSSYILINNSWEVKLAHFGRSRLCLSEFTEPSCLDSSDILWYQPPERLLGEEQITAATDIWSCGCILAELFIKMPMFESKEKFMQLELICQLCGSISTEIWPDVTRLPWFNDFDTTKLYPRRLTEIFSYLPKSVTELLDRMLVHNPKSRVTTKEALSSTWLRDVDPRRINPPRLPKTVDCHGMWYEKPERSIGRIGGTGDRVQNPVSSTPRASSPDRSISQALYFSRDIDERQSAFGICDNKSTNSRLFEDKPCSFQTEMTVNQKPCIEMTDNMMQSACTVKKESETLSVNAQLMKDILQKIMVPVQPREETATNPTVEPFAMNWATNYKPPEVQKPEFGDYDGYQGVHSAAMPDLLGSQTAGVKAALAQLLTQQGLNVAIGGSLVKNEQKQVERETHTSYCAEFEFYKGYSSTLANTHESRPSPSKVQEFNTANAGELQHQAEYSYEGSSKPLQQTSGQEWNPYSAKIEPREEIGQRDASRPIKQPLLPLPSNKELYPSPVKTFESRDAYGDYNYPSASEKSQSSIPGFNPPHEKYGFHNAERATERFQPSIRGLDSHRVGIERHEEYYHGATRAGGGSIPLMEEFYHPHSVETNRYQPPFMPPDVHQSAGLESYKGLGNNTSKNSYQWQMSEGEVPFDHPSSTRKQFNPTQSTDMNPVSGFSSFTDASQRGPASGSNAFSSPTSKPARTRERGTSSRMNSSNSTLAKPRMHDYYESYEASVDDDVQDI